VGEMTEAKKRWDKENTTFIGLKLNNNTDAKLIKKLKSVPNRQGYLKQLIKADIEKRGL
jgi:hypothetical protein